MYDGDGGNIVSRLYIQKKTFDLHMHMSSNSKGFNPDSGLLQTSITPTHIYADNNNDYTEHADNKNLERIDHIISLGFAIRVHN